MGKFNEYSQKATPADNDTLMIYDETSKANKLSPFSGIWNWIVGKLTNAVISNLQTSNKTVLGAINELNSKPSWSYNKSSNTIDIPFLPESLGNGIVFGEYKQLLLRVDETGMRLSGLNNSTGNWEIIWRK